MVFLCLYSILAHFKSFCMIIFHSVLDAIRAGYQIVSPIPDNDGFIHARILTSDGWATALVRP